MLRATILALLFEACATTHNASKLTLQEADKSSKSLSCSNGTLVLIPEKDKSKAHAPPTPTEKVAKRLAQEIARFCPTVRVERLALQQGLDVAHSRGFDIVVAPQVVEWEKRATQWSGIPAVVEVKVTVYDPNSGLVIDDQDIRSESGGMIWSATSPDTLLKQAVPVWARTVF